MSRKKHSRKSHIILIFCWLDQLWKFLDLNYNFPLFQGKMSLRRSSVPGRWCIHLLQPQRKAAGIEPKLVDNWMETTLGNCKRAWEAALHKQRLFPVGCCAGQIGQLLDGCGHCEYNTTHSALLSSCVPGSEFHEQLCRWI